MRQRIMTHVTVLVVLSVLLTYLAASLVLYHKYRGDMQADVIKEGEYIRYALENVGEEYLAKDLGQLTTSRITVLNSQGEKVYDSNPGEDQENYGEMEEIQEAQDQGIGQALRFSGMLSHQTFYYAVRLENGDIPPGREDRGQYFPYYDFQLSPFRTDHGANPDSGFLYMNYQTQKLIEPINCLDLEKPLKNVVYEELRPAAETGGSAEPADRQSCGRTETGGRSKKRVFC